MPGEAAAERVQPDQENEAPKLSLVAAEPPIMDNWMRYLVEAPMLHDYGSEKRLGQSAIDELKKGYELT